MAMFKCVGALFDGTININTVAGSTVTATTSATTQVFQAVADVTGLAVIKVKKKGTYAIASTGSTRLGHATVNDRTPVTAYYEWQKWESQLYYIPTVTETYSSPTGFWYGSWQYCYSWRSATSYSFNDTNGTFTLNGGSGGKYPTGGTSAAYIRSTGNYVFFSYPTSTNNGNVTTTMGEYVPGQYDTDIIWNASYYSWWNISGTSPGLYGYVRQWQTSTSYRKGSTQYENATATTLDALPQNGRNTSDGYWYIAS